MHLFGDEINEAFSPHALKAVIRRAEFRVLVKRMAAGALQYDLSRDDATRWMTRDLGRTSIYFSILALDATLGQISVADLVKTMEMNKTCSRGRVLAFIEYAQRAGRLEVPPGAEHWTRRPLRLRKSFFDYGKGRIWAEIERLVLIDPDVGQALLHRDDPEALRVVLETGAFMTVLRPDLFYGLTHPILTFMRRDAGMRILHDWVSRQSPEQERLLEAAPLERTKLSERYDISRAHLNQLLADASAEGLLWFPSPKSICFTPKLSDDLERHFAFVIQSQRLLAKAVDRAFASLHVRSVARRA